MHLVGVSVGVVVARSGCAELVANHKIAEINHIVGRNGKRACGGRIFGIVGTILGSVLHLVVYCTGRCAGNAHLGHQRPLVLGRTCLLAYAVEVELRRRAHTCPANVGAHAVVHHHIVGILVFLGCGIIAAGGAAANAQSEGLVGVEARNGHLRIVAPHLAESCPVHGGLGGYLIGDAITVLLLLHLIAIGVFVGERVFFEQRLAAVAVNHIQLEHLVDFVAHDFLKRCAPVERHRIAVGAGHLSSVGAELHCVEAHLGGIVLVIVGVVVARSAILLVAVVPLHESLVGDEKRDVVERLLLGALAAAHRKPVVGGKHRAAVVNHAKHVTAHHFAIEVGDARRCIGGNGAELLIHAHKRVALGHTCAARPTAFCASCTAFRQEKEPVARACELI